MQPELRERARSERQTQAPATGASPNAGARWLIWLRNLGIAAAAGLFLAFVGAFDTGPAPLTTRLLYWAPLLMAGALLGQATSGLLSRFPRATLNPWVFGALLALVLSIPATLVVWGYTDLMFGAAISVAGLPVLFFSVLLISAAMTAIMIAVNWPGRMTHAAPPFSGAPAAPRFADRLPPKLKGAVIYAVSAEDHYLRLHTSKGSDLILMRLSDALSELEGLEGAQTHRSWWVARDAVEGMQRDGDKVTLTLKGGAMAPVSRPNVRPLREAGWF